MRPSKVKIPFLAGLYHKWNYYPGSGNVYLATLNAPCAAGQVHFSLPDWHLAECRRASTRTAASGQLRN
jgi:hypothetical protein